MTAPLFITDRTRVRQLTATDLAAMLEIYGDPDSMKWVGDGDPITSEECSKWLVITQRNYETRGYGMSVIESKATREVLGFCGLVHPGGQSTPEIKYAFAREHWGKGFATEVAAGMLEYGKQQFAMGEIIATVHEDNHASLRVLEKCGLRHVELQDGTVLLSSE